ncbi:MAG TPA: hypothetical protein VIJ41_05960 [Candidatus Nanopelagicales bacterium]
MSQPRTSVAPASPQRRSLSVRGRLFSLVAVLCSLWLVSVGVAVYGLSGPRSQVDSLAASFEVSNDASRAYESWLSDDSASNMYVALASLNDSKQAKLIEDTWALVVDGHAAAVDHLTKVKDSGIDGVETLASAALTDLAAYDAFTQKVRSDVQSGDVTGGVKVMTVDNLDASTKLDTSLNALVEKLSADVTSTRDAGKCCGDALDRRAARPGRDRARASRSSSSCGSSGRSPGRSTRSRRRSSRWLRAISRCAPSSTRTTSSAGWPPA